ncbi:hypothetical protein F9L16_23275 [Agarivorans sp. B2Z047]|uniref:hypothetical protein n=1 Tax=Agarivorans sp. B2Z047 TaxID=2652721 RepID=UPI00128BB05D|nr:hypothetical protein [Agarivorans sp. B2Z047]MPW31881.1 hypothetical protein [Agarivorans sp. B2Z047]UQN43678.1 hypothetical protein LQZ07_04165 [Agarivorans sp. B2Z047]
MKVLYLYRHEVFSKQLSLSFACRVSAGLQKRVKLAGVSFPPSQTWACLPESWTEGLSPLTMHSTIDFNQRLQAKTLKAHVQRYIEYVAAKMTHLSRGQHLPFFDGPGPISAQFDEVAVLVRGPYPLHHDYAAQCDALLAWRFPDEIEPEGRIAQLYQRQSIYFPVSLLSLVRALASTFKREDSLARCLELVNYLSHHCDKADLAFLCYKSAPQIQADLGLSQSTLSRWLGLLTQKGWIIAHTRKLVCSERMIELTPLFWQHFSGLTVVEYEREWYRARKALSNWRLDHDRLRYSMHWHRERIWRVESAYKRALKESRIALVKQEAKAGLIQLRYT